MTTVQLANGIHEMAGHFLNRQRVENMFYVASACIKGCFSGTAEHSHIIRGRFEHTRRRSTCLKTPKTKPDTVSKNKCVRNDCGGIL